MPEIKLTVEKEAADKDDLLSQLDTQARQFFGDAPYRIDGPIRVDVIEEIRTVDGNLVHRMWRGACTYVNLIPE